MFRRKNMVHRQPREVLPVLFPPRSGRLGLVNKPFFSPTVNPIKIQRNTQILRKSPYSVPTMPRPFRASLAEETLHPARIAHVSTEHAVVPVESVTMQITLNIEVARSLSAQSARWTYAVSLDYAEMARPSKFLVSWTPRGEQFRIFLSFLVWICWARLYRISSTVVWYIRRPNQIVRMIIRMIWNKLQKVSVLTTPPANHLNSIIALETVINRWPRESSQNRPRQTLN